MLQELQRTWMRSRKLRGAIIYGYSKMHVKRLVFWGMGRRRSFGVMGSFSFSSSQISTIEGGMVVTNEKPMADQLRALRAHERI